MMFIFVFSCKLRTSINECFYHAMVSHLIFNLFTQRDSLTSLGFDLTGRKRGSFEDRSCYLERSRRVSKHYQKIWAYIWRAPDKVSTKIYLRNKWEKRDWGLNRPITSRGALHFVRAHLCLPFSQGFLLSGLMLLSMFSFNLDPGFQDQLTLFSAWKVFKAPSTIEYKLMQ